MKKPLKYILTSKFPIMDHGMGARQGTKGSIPLNPMGLRIQISNLTNIIAYKVLEKNYGHVCSIFDERMLCSGLPTKIAIYPPGGTLTFSPLAAF